MDMIIECRDIKRTFTSRTLLGKRHETVALNELNFAVEKGIVFGLLGPNGSGKTTTIRILATLLTPTAGQARVLGFDCVKDAGRVRGRIGLILGGERGLYGRLTGMENLRYFAALNHLSREQTRQRVKEILVLVGLTESADRPVEQYSRGMRQRLHIARGLLTDPEVIFMDEPTIGLDPAGAQELRQLVPTLIARGKTILLTTHYMSEADELSARVAIINRGRVIATGTPSEIKRTFGKIAIMEVGLRQVRPDAAECCSSIGGVEKASSLIDGPVQRLTLQMRPGLDIRPEVRRLLGEESIDYISQRDPTLEEAYLNIIK
jgi:ABC-2 type transport system ATP-binding protein